MQFLCIGFNQPQIIFAIEKKSVWKRTHTIQTMLLKGQMYIFLFAH